VVDDSRDPDTVANETSDPRGEWQPLSNSTDYGGGFDPPWIEDVEEPSQRRWYGWQTLLVDALSVSAVVIGAENDNSKLAVAGVFGYVFGGAVVHGAHEHTGRALTSFGLRLGAPIVGGIVGSRVGHCASDDLECQVSGSATGVLIGAGAAVLIDAFVLANEDEVPSSAPRIVPSAELTRDRALFTLGGVF